MGELPKILAIIPARRGSKGIPNKNMALLAGKPLIAWTISEALRAQEDSPYPFRVLVSTDCEETAQLARKEGLEVPFLRPSELAHDESSILDVVFHCLDWLKDKEGYAPDFVLLLQPTSPLRQAKDISLSIGRAVESGADAVVSVTPSTHSPYRMKTMDVNGLLSDFLENPYGEANRQALPVTFDLNGAIFLVRLAALEREKTFHCKKTLSYSMPVERSIDIDTPWDLQVADLLLNEQMKER